MSWQEQLRKLDEELASGQISADEYRVRRDQVLSSAVSMDTGTESRQLSTPKQSSAFAPPAPSGPAQPAQGAQQEAEGTQAIPRPGVRDEPTQVVGGWQAARPNGDDADSTQVVPGVPPQSGFGGQQLRPPPGPGQPGWGQQTQPGWQQHEEDLSPPWAGSTFPPLAATDSHNWVQQGPEVFEERSSTGKKVLITALIALVLGGAGVGAYLFINKSSDNPPPVTQSSASQPTQKPTATSPPRPSDPYVALLENMPKPPASLQQEGKILEPAQLTQLNLMDAAEVDLATAAGAKKVVWRSAVRKSPADGPTPDVLSAIVIPLDSEASAKELLEKLRKYQEANGMLFIEEPLPNMPRSVIFEKSVTADRGLYRGLYVSGKNLIRVTTVQEPLTNEAALSGSYRNHTEAMLRVFPSE